MNCTGQSEKEKRFYEQIAKKNREKTRLPRGQYIPSEMSLGDE